MTPRREWGGPDRGVLRGERDPGFLQGQPAGLFPGPPALRVPLGGVTMRAALMSIKPEWWEKILAGEKTMEIRKTAPQGGAGEPDPWPMLVLVYVSGTGRGAGEIPLSRIRKNQPAGRTAKAGLHTDGRSGGLCRRTREKRVRLDRGKTRKNSTNKDRWRSLG